MNKHQENYLYEDIIASDNEQDNSEESSRILPRIVQQYINLIKIEILWNTLQRTKTDDISYDEREVRRFYNNDLTLNSVQRVKAQIYDVLIEHYAYKEKDVSKFVMRGIYELKQEINSYMNDNHHNAASITKERKLKNAIVEIFKTFRADIYYLYNDSIMNRSIGRFIYSENDEMIKYVPK